MTPLGAADGLPTSMPWWMGVAIVGLWLALLVAIVAIISGRRRLARARRPELLARSGELPAGSDRAAGGGPRGGPRELASPTEAARRELAPPGAEDR